MSKTKKAIVLIICGLTMPLLLIGGNMKILSFYPVAYTDKDPVIDGKLDEGAWKKATLYTSYYEYWKPNPGPAKTKTGFKMLYGRNGVFLAIINYDKNLSALKANYTTRDASALWTDDCDEIYIDPFGDGVGYTKFIINSIGTQSDFRRIDAAVTLSEWSGSGWIVGTSKTADAWIGECFFPWEDLGGRVEPGKLWRFCTTRYAYTSGKFIGSTSAPGGNYNNPGNFGYLYFYKDQPASPETVGEILSHKATPPWMLLLGDDLITCKGPGNYTKEKMAKVINDKISQFNSLKIKVSKLLAENKYQKLQENADKIFTDAEKVKPGNGMSALRKISELSDKLDRVFWQLKVINLVESN